MDRDPRGSAAGWILGGMLSAAGITLLLWAHVVSPRLSLYRVMREAERDYWAGTAAWRTYGEGARDESHMDPASGLVCHAVAGCCVSEELVESIEAYNGRLAEMIRRHGRPANSLIRRRLPPERIAQALGRPEARVRSATGPTGIEIKVSDMREQADVFVPELYSTCTLQEGMDPGTCDAITVEWRPEPQWVLVGRWRDGRLRAVYNLWNTAVIQVYHIYWDDEKCEGPCAEHLHLKSG